MAGALDRGVGPGRLRELGEELAGRRPGTGVRGPVRAFAARDPESGALVGGCELRLGPDGTGEVSYWTHASQRGRGHARDALALLVGYAASIGVTRLEARIAHDNHASRRVAEAVGFAQAGTFTDDGGTEMLRYTRGAS